MRMTALILLFCATRLHAQEPVAQLPAAEEPEPPRTAEHSLLAGNEFASLLADQVPSSYEWLLATVSVEDKAAGVSWAPFLAGKTYNEFFSETRFSVGQKDGKTNLGVVLRWNPLSPRSRRGMTAWADTKAKGFGDEYAKLRGLRWEALGYQDDYLSLDRPEILGLPERINDLTRRSQELGLDPSKKKSLDEEIDVETKKLNRLREEARIARRARLLAAIESKRKELSSLSAGDPRRETLILEIDQLLASVSPGASELVVIEAEIAAAEKAVAKKSSSLVAAFEQDLFTKPLPVVSLSYTGSLFSGIGGSFVDADSDGLDDNAHLLAARSLLFSGLIRFGPKRQLSMAVGRSWKRGSAEEGAVSSKGNNYAVTFARRLKVLDPEYARSEDYLSSLFVPSIVGGLSAELSECDSPVADCQEKAERILAITPFVDVKLKKAVQFRVGLNWKRFSGSAIADEQFGIVSLIGLQLGLPN